MKRKTFEEKREETEKRRNEREKVPSPLVRTFFILDCKFLSSGKGYYY
jgi:hypothetical protein